MMIRLGTVGGIGGITTAEPSFVNGELVLNGSETQRLLGFASALNASA